MQFLISNDICIRVCLTLTSCVFFIPVCVFPGGEQQRHSGNVAVYGVCVRGVQQRARSTAPHLSTHQGITHTHIHTHVETHVWPLLGVFFFSFFVTSELKMSLKISFSQTNS